jgi:hypothetical protein
VEGNNNPLNNPPSRPPTNPITVERTLVRRAETVMRIWFTRMITWAITLARAGRREKRMVWKECIKMREMLTRRANWMTAGCRKDNPAAARAAGKLGAVRQSTIDLASPLMCPTPAKNRFKTLAKEKEWVVRMVRRVGLTLIRAFNLTQMFKKLVKLKAAAAFATMTGLGADLTTCTTGEENPVRSETCTCRSIRRKAARHIC